MPVATAPLSDFDSLVMPYAPGLPRPSARRFIRQAAIEFCERTRCWREILTVTVDEANEAIITPAYAALHRIEEAIYNDEVKLQPTQYTDVSLSERVSEGMPGYIFQTSPNTISLMPYATGTVKVSAFLKPIEGSDMELNAGGETVDALDVLPVFMLTQYGPQIACGALALALMVPGQPFTNPQQAMYYRQKFDRACDDHFASNITMQVRAPGRSRLREW